MSKQAKVGRKLKLQCMAKGSSLQKIESRAEKGAVMIVQCHVLSGWLASCYPIRHAFLQHISERNRDKLWPGGRQLACMQTLPTYL